MTAWLDVFDIAGPMMARTVWQSAIVAAVVFGVVTVFGQWISARWRFAIWSLVFVRLVLPIAPPAPTSLFRLLPVPSAVESGERVSGAAALMPSAARPASPPRAAFPSPSRDPSEVRMTIGHRATRAATTELPAMPVGGARASGWSLWKIAGLIWLAGTILLGTRLSLQIWSLVQRQRTWRIVSDPNLLSLLTECRRTMGIVWPVALRVSPADTSPAVTGIWRPSVVLPEGSLTELSRAQLKMVLLHELAHVRRRDVLVHWLLILVRLVYWFNPVAWLVGWRMQAEREQACDEMVLDAVGASQRHSYGATLVAMASDFPAPMNTPGLLGAISGSGRLHRRIAMIRNYRRRSWPGALSAVTVLALVSAVGLTDAPRRSQGQEEDAKPAATSADDQPAAEGKKSPARKLLEVLKAIDNRSFREDQAHLARTIRELVKIGPDAVPELIEELDTTQSEMAMRSLGFTLRAIGDKRAVPALIRALPKTCLPPSSDYGLRVDDPELMEFMRKHDTDDQDRLSDTFHFGRPVVEIGSAMAKLTAQSHGEDEILAVFLNGSDHQQRLQRKLYQRCAQRWTEWWEANWKDHVKDEAYARVSLYVRKDLESKREFPHGPQVRFAEPMEGMILQSVHAPDTEAVAPFGKMVFLDLDTNRFGPLPERLRSPSGEPERMDEISAWAAREGFDVMGTEYTLPGEKQPHYVLRSLGLTAWQIETDLWNTIEEELKKPDSPALGTPAAGLLAHYDETVGQYDPKEFATFLFVTREGGHGALFVGAEVTDTSLKPGSPSLGARATERSNVGFVKGRRLSFRLVEDPTK